jgi:hypothetical protein
MLHLFSGFVFGIKTYSGFSKRCLGSSKTTSCAGSEVGTSSITRWPSWPPGTAWGLSWGSVSPHFVVGVVVQTVTGAALLKVRSRTCCTFFVLWKLTVLGISVRAYTGARARKTDWRQNLKELLPVCLALQTVQAKANALNMWKAHCVKANHRFEGKVLCFEGLSIITLYVDFVGTEPL